MQLLLTDYELVILALRTHTCLQAKIYQCVSFALFHSQLITYIIIIIIIFVYWRLSNATNKEQWHNITT